MPSFDVVSEIDQHEFTNAIDQANREIGNRFDFKGTNSSVDTAENGLTIISSAELISVNAVSAVSMSVA